MRAASSAVSGGVRLAARLLRLLGGLALYSLGIALTLRARVGYAPWDVFHTGLAAALGMSIGFASILTGLAVVLVSLALGERIGLGTLGNMALIGLMLDAVLASGLVPLASGPLTGAAMMAAGLFVIAFATYLYMSSGFGSGPRDGLMVALTRKTKLPIGLVRALIEITAVLVGWRLGGLVGWGTVAAALGAGLCIQLVFALLRFDAKAIRHESLGESLGLRARREGR